MKTKDLNKSKKRKNMWLAIILAIASFVGGIVSEKNKTLGTLIQTVVGATAPVVFSNTDSIAVKDLPEKGYIKMNDTTVFIDTITYTSSPFTIVGFDTFEVTAKLNNLQLPKNK